MSPTRNFSGWRQRKAPTKRIARKRPATVGAMSRPAINGSNKNPQAPCSSGRAIDFAGIRLLAGIESVDPCILLLLVDGKDRSFEFDSLREESIIFQVYMLVKVLFQFVEANIKG